ncbi:DUF4339 domain-containing protein [Larkinella punicea]|uniref:DUF4339 domain-containing protein n=1 Tax=Larkinella punicea TaxID=2315727 RepID=A0A368JLA5_9BACT|nr:DUF4339 domain-containing protein [Larkinella punicea]RCR67454.1 DUF4339 domain-containing protein [Larkinella punicea]
MHHPTYYLVENDQRQGPFTREQLAGLSLTPNTLVWYPGSKQWQRAYHVEEIRRLFPAWESGETIDPEETASEKASTGMYVGLIIGTLALVVLVYLFSRSDWSTMNQAATKPATKHRLPPTANEISEARQKPPITPVEADSIMVFVDEPANEEPEQVPGFATQPPIENGLESSEQPSFAISNLIADPENYARWKGHWSPVNGDVFSGDMALKKDGLIFWIAAQLILNCTGRFEGNKLILSFQEEDGISSLTYPRSGSDILEMQRLPNEQCQIRWLNEELRRQVIAIDPNIESGSILRRIQTTD